MIPIYITILYCMIATWQMVMSLVLTGNAFKSVLQNYCNPNLCIFEQKRKQTTIKKFCDKVGIMQQKEIKQGKVIYTCNYSGDV